eukprot:gene39789-55684_t
MLDRAVSPPAALKLDPNPGRSASVLRRGHEFSDAGTSESDTTRSVPWEDGAMGRIGWMEEASVHSEAAHRQGTDAWDRYQILYIRQINSGTALLLPESAFAASAALSQLWARKAGEETEMGFGDIMLFNYGVMWYRGVPYWLVPGREIRSRTWECWQEP